MVEIIIDKRDNSVTVEGPLNSRWYIFRSFSKNNQGIVPTYVLHVTNEEQMNIKLTFPQCNTIITEIPNKM